VKWHAIPAKLWCALRPDVTRKGGRVTREWEEIGFQGDEPGRDFRAMGVLGLENLVYFAETYPKSARSVLFDSMKPNWFPFAITGINITYDLFKLTKANKINYYYYLHGADLRSFQRLYCLTFVLFNDEWHTLQPKTIMEFSRIHEPFLSQLKATLQDSPQSLDFSRLHVS